jgi:hypothetical protein
MCAVSDTYQDNNLYAVLVRKIYDLDEPFGLISFNYDTLLDSAIHSNLIPLNSMQDYQRVRYVKPHGSVNWFLPARTEDVNEVISGYSTRIIVDNAVHRMFNGSPLDGQNVRVRRPVKHQIVSMHTHSTHTSYTEQLDASRVYPLVFMPLTTKL